MANLDGHGNYTCKLPSLSAKNHSSKAIGMGYADSALAPIILKLIDYANINIKLSSSSPGHQ